LCFDLKCTELCAKHLKNSTRYHQITQLSKTKKKTNYTTGKCALKNGIIQNCILQSPVILSTAFKIEKILVYKSRRGSSCK
jgi:hypothetical protein